MKTAIVTGVNGQDGSYLAELLLEKGYRVVGIIRRSSVDNTERITDVKKDPLFELVEGDITDQSSVNQWLIKYKPDEFYNLAAQSHVGTSFTQPLLTWRVDAEAVLNILEGIRHHSPETRFYQASTSEMFGKNVSMDYDVEGRTVRYGGEFPGKGSCVYVERDGKDFCRPINDQDGVFQDEDTPLAPQSPYAVAKVAAHHAVAMYRKAYGLHASCGILFNHESERRGEQFVTRKITKWIGEFINWRNQEFYTVATLFLPDDQISYGIPKSEPETFPKLRLGNLEAYRDWGHAKDYVYAMWLMLQQKTPDDYVIATGKTYSVEDFLREAFKAAGIDDFKPLIMQDPKFMRPAEVDYLLGDAYKAKDKLGWEPKITFEELVSKMVKHDINRL